MKFKFALFFAAATLLASCGNHATGLSISESSSEPEQTLYLDWVAKNKIVIDLYSIGEARFAYGNAALSQASTTLDLSASSALTCSSTHEESELFNFVYVTETTEGTRFNASAMLYPGIKGDALTEFLSNNTELAGKTRAYIAISKGDTVQWAKGKNAAMDAKIQALIGAAN